MLRFTPSKTNISGLSNKGTITGVYAPIIMDNKRNECLKVMVHSKVPKPSLKMSMVKLERANSGLCNMQQRRDHL